MQLLFVGLGLVLGVLMLLVRVPLLELYDSVSKETRRLANGFMLIQSVVIYTMSYQMPVNTGIIRGGGDTRFVMWLDVVSIWCIVLPLSYLGSTAWGWSPYLLVLSLNADQIFKCIPAAIRCNSYRWVRRLTRGAEERTPAP